jgi:hypothetical protein
VAEADRGGKPSPLQLIAREWLAEAIGVTHSARLKRFIPEEYGRRELLRTYL